MSLTSPSLNWHAETSGLPAGGSIPLDGGSISLAAVPDSSLRVPLLLVRAGECDDYVVSSQNPRQPLLINGQQVQQAELRHGDVLNIGQIEMIYESPLPLRQQASPLTARTFLGSLLCSVLLFALLLPFLSQQLVNGSGSGESGTGHGDSSALAGSGGGGQGTGTSESQGTGVGSGSGQGQSQSPGGSGPSSSQSATGTATSGNGADKTSPTAGVAASGPQTSNAPAAAAASATPAPPMPGNANSGQPESKPVTPGSQPAAKVVRSLGQLAAPRQGAVSFSWNGGNIFQGYGNAKSRVFVVDRSGSMGGGKLDEAKQQLMDQVQAVMTSKNPGKFSVIFFNQGFETMPGANGLQPTTAANVAALRQWVDSITTSGGTDPKPGVTEALDMEPDVIYLLSDGQFSSQAVDAIKRANRSNTLICTISIWVDASSLREVAEQNKGALAQGDYRYIQRQP